MRVCLPAHTNKRFCLLWQQHLFVINLGIFSVVSEVNGDPCCVLANHVILAGTTEMGYNNVGVTWSHQFEGFFLQKSGEAGVSVPRYTTEHVLVSEMKCCHKVVCSCCSLNATVLIFTDLTVVLFSLCKAVDADIITQVLKCHYLTSIAEKWFTQVIAIKGRRQLPKCLN